MIKEVKDKKLRIFDFDDTLAKVKATIYVRNGNKNFTLTPAEFAVYVAKPGDVFNFKDFNSVIRKAVPIQKNINLLKQAASSVNTKVTILTARMLAYPVKRYLKQLYNLDIYVVALGHSDPQKKADYIEKEILKGYSDIVFIDDSLKNVNAVMALKTKYPDVSLEAIHTTEAEHIDLKESGFVDNIKAKFNNFISKLKQEKQETVDAFKLVVKASKGEITLTDEQKTQIGDQLKDVFKTIGLTAIAILPGGVIAALLLRLLKQQNLIIPSAFK